MIVGQNSLLNQYVPTFFVKDIVDGQILEYNSTKKAFINVNNTGTHGVESFVELSDVSSTPLPGGLVIWDEAGEVLVYTDTIPADYIAGLATVATTGDYNDLINIPSTTGTVTSVAASGGTTGLSFTGSPITSSGTLTIDGVLNVANGGTGISSVNDFQLFIGQEGSIIQTVGLSFDPGAMALQLGSAYFAVDENDDLEIFSTADILLSHGSTNSVFIGSESAASQISSGSGQTLTISSDAQVIIESGIDVNLVLAPTYKVTVSGQTATEYATDLNDDNLVNKKYVDVSINSSTTQLVGWAYAKAFAWLNVTRNGTDGIDHADIMWPDGTSGDFVTTEFNGASPSLSDAWTITYLGTPIQWIITQNTITRDGNGEISTQPALTISQLN
jgi:hypothetical protein